MDYRNRDSVVSKHSYWISFCDHYSLILTLQAPQKFVLDLVNYLGSDAQVNFISSSID